MKGSEAWNLVAPVLGDYCKNETFADAYVVVFRALQYYDERAKLNDCNSCGNADCKVRPGLGSYVRINCPLWVEEKECEKTK